MATLALAAVGAAAGGALLPAGVSLLGATLTGAAIGSQIGAFAGSYIDQTLFGASGGRAVRGPRLSELQVTASTEGAAIPRVYGRVRLGGQIIWAAAIEEETVTSSSGSGSAKGAAASAQSRVTEYRYYASFAVALAEGEIQRIGRVWVDGAEFDLSSAIWRLHPGSETQTADSLIVAHEGAANAPAYRGVAYIVFERLPLADFGNRIPQLSFEVTRAIGRSDADIRGVVLIPGSGEFVYATEPVMQTLGDGVSVSENVHTRQGATDWAVAIDDLEASLPNARRVSLIVSWFGDDLRAGSCQLRPRVERAAKSTKPKSWKVAGVTRASAHVVSQRDGRPAYGGTPSDDTVVAAIRDLKARGISVTLTPFILMDVAEGNALADPYGGASQAAYPWRGRITVHPAAGRSGSPDKTAAAAAAVAAFAGTAVPGHFSLSGDSVVYSGPAEWSFRRMVLHHAFLAKAAGGVDTFVIGSEMRGLTWVRSAAATYPFVQALIALAADVRVVLGAGTKIIYGADWSEYFGHQPGDGSGDVYFHLDPLWASANIDAIGVDLYWPLSDWREGRSHLDATGGAGSIYDLDYLASNVRGGEGFDWYYASDAHRAAQSRTAITDGAGKPWVFRYKDMAAWWSNPHYNRPGGVEAATATAWVPGSKPIWFMEIGCPAVDKGANQPNVFVDPKSSESAFPYFSNGLRDDHMQRQYLAALIAAFDWTSPLYQGGNPVSALTGQRMADLGRMYVYCWDARPYPAFPFDTETWGDGDNWSLGHWLNGRLAAAPLGDLVARVLDDQAFADYDASGLAGSVPGYVIDRVMSAREALQALELAYFFDSVETGGNITFRHRGSAGAVASLDLDGLVEEKAGDALLSLTRGQETDLPASAKMRFISGASDYRQAVAEARRLIGTSGRVAEADLPIVWDAGTASGIAETWLHETWAARERAAFKLPPSLLKIEPGDVVTLDTESGARTVRVTEIGEHGVRDVEALGIDLDIYGGVGGAERPRVPSDAGAVGSPAVVFLDLPLLDGSSAPETGYIAAFQKPWPGGVSIYSSAGTDGYRFRVQAGVPATIGVTLDALAPGPEGRIDRARRFRVQLTGGLLTSVTQDALFGGANGAAIQRSDGSWEVLQFETAALVAPMTYELSGLVRAQLGTDGAMALTAPVGARFVLLNSALAAVALGADEIALPYNWRHGPSNRDIGHASYEVTTHAFKGAGRRPYSPVHVRGRRAGGDLAITWIRRTRTGGDSWEAAEVALGEDNERYEVDVMAGSTIKRTLTAPTPSVSYTAAQQAADFGAAQSSVSVRIYQLSTVAGRGTGRAAVL